MPSRGLSIFFALPLIVACGPDASTPTAPSAPVTVAPVVASPPPSGGQANWRGDAVVISRTGTGGCGWGTSVGDARSGVLWRVVIDGDAVSLDEDMGNWPTDDIPFKGARNGREFRATYSQRDDYLLWVCQFRGAELSGSFSDELSSFEAIETLYWGPPDGETRVQRRWRVSRFSN